MNCNEFMSFLLHTWKDKLSDSLVGRRKKREKNTLSLRFVILYKGKLLINREQEPRAETQRGKSAAVFLFM
jgi:hypothetical protein